MNKIVGGLKNMMHDTVYYKITSNNTVIENQLFKTIQEALNYASNHNLKSVINITEVRGMQLPSGTLGQMLTESQG